MLTGPSVRPTPTEAGRGAVRLPKLLSATVVFNSLNSGSRTHAGADRDSGGHGERCPVARAGNVDGRGRSIRNGDVYYSTGHTTPAVGNRIGEAVSAVSVHR